MVKTDLEISGSKVCLFIIGADSHMNYLGSGQILLGGLNISTITIRIPCETQIKNFLHKTKTRFVRGDVNILWIVFCNLFRAQLYTVNKCRYILCVSRDLHGETPQN